MVVDQTGTVIITVNKGICQISQLLHKSIQYVGIAYSQGQAGGLNLCQFSGEKPISDPYFRPVYKADGSIPTEAERSELNFQKHIAVHLLDGTV